MSKHFAVPVVPRRISMAALARAVVADTAPEQLEYFALVAPARGRRRLSTWHGGAVGSGITQVLTSDIIYPVLAGVFTQMVGGGAVAGWRWWTGRRRTAIDGNAVLPFRTDAAYLAEFRAAFIAACLALDIPDVRTNVLADTAVGILIRKAEEPDPGEPSGDEPTAP